MLRVILKSTGVLREKSTQILFSAFTYTFFIYHINISATQVIFMGPFKFQEQKIHSKRDILT